MHEVDRGVGLQKISPGPLRRMGLTGNQQHPQPVAYAVDRYQGPVVDGRQLAFRRSHRHFRQGRPGVVQLDRVGLVLADRNQGGFRLDSVDLELHLGRRPARGAVLAGVLVLDPVGDDHFLADDAVAGRVLDDQAPVGLVPLAGQQHMQRPAQARVSGGGGRFIRCALGRLAPQFLGQVVDLAVGDDDGPGEAMRRDFRRRRGQRIHQAGARPVVGGGIGDLDDADLQVLLIVDGGHQFLFGIGNLFQALAGFLARCPVDDDQCLVRLGFALFVDDAGVGQGQQQHAEKKEAE